MMMYAWAERLELHELVNKAAKTAKDFKIDLMLIENKASGHSVAQEIRRLYGREDFGVKLCDPKSQDKVSRLYSVQHIFAEGLIFAPEKAWAEQVITQVGQFPKGKHDDLVDTVSQAVRHIRETGILVRPEEARAHIDSELRHRGSPPRPLYEC
jgi:predicted phage terminase large subunit-like protein